MTIHYIVGLEEGFCLPGCDEKLQDQTTAMKYIFGKRSNKML